jgi:PAS domain S-box-containing protein
MDSKPILPGKGQLNITDAIPAMTWVAGIDKLCYFFNSSWLSFTGKTLDQELGNGWTQGIHPDDLQKFLSAYDQAYDKKQQFQITFRLKRNDNEYRWVVNNVSPYFSENGSFAGYVGSGIEIHEIAEAEALRDEFINSASHELKIPVTTIKVYAQLLEDFFGRQGDEKHLNFLKKVNRQVIKLTKLINNLAETNKLHQSGVKLNKVSFDFNNLISQEIAQTQNDTLKHNIEVNGYVSRNVYGDRDRLAQALSNLLDNAIKFSPDADTVEIFLTENSDTFTVSVKDRGIGIDGKEKEKIFKRFYRVHDKTANTFPGLGLGLYISSQIIKQHGGEIKVENNNPGSNFTFTLPYDNHM